MITTAHRAIIALQLDGAASWAYPDIMRRCVVSSWSDMYKPDELTDLVDQIYQEQKEASNEHH